MNIPFPIPIKVRVTPENKCGLCTNSTCCTYFTQRIDGPRSMENFDELLWQIAHFNTQVYKDDEGWFLLVNNRCTHLLTDGRCAIYDERPQICRDHTNDDCEFNEPAGADDFNLFFPDYPALLKYCEKRFKNWNKRFQGDKTAAPPKQVRRTGPPTGRAVPASRRISSRV